MNSQLNYLYKMSLCRCAGASAGSEEGEEEELVLKPLKESFTKPLNSALLLTCEVTGAKENTNYNIKWLGDNGREIVDRSGRSVIVTFIPAYTTLQPLLAYYLTLIYHVCLLLIAAELDCISEFFM